MYEIHDLSTAAMQTELDYRRKLLVGPRDRAVSTHGRWWRRRTVTNR